MKLPIHRPGGRYVTCILQARSRVGSVLLSPQVSDGLVLGHLYVHLQLPVPN